VERRDLLRAGVVLGTGLVVGDLAGGREAEAAAAPKFFEGTVTGGPLNACSIKFAVLGNEVFGFAFGGATNAFHVKGAVGKKKMITAQLFALDDINFATPVGTLTGTVKGKGIQGNLTVNSQPGTFTVLQPLLDARILTLLRRTYNVSVLNNVNETVTNFVVTIRKGGSFTINNITFPGAPLTAQQSNPDIEGFIAVRRDGNKLVLLRQGLAMCVVAQLFYSTVFLLLFLGGSARDGFAARPENLAGYRFQFDPV
jgi:hypothetical protein